MTDLGIAEDLRPFVDHYIEWFRANVEEVMAIEKIVVHPEGFAGCLDLHCRLRDGTEAILDYKTQGVKNEKANFYDSWIWQLAAYRACLPGRRKIQCISLVVDSGTPSPVVEKRWARGEAWKAWQVFRHALRIWQLRKKFKPNKEDLDEVVLREQRALAARRAERADQGERAQESPQEAPEGQVEPHPAPGEAVAGAADHL